MSTKSGVILDSGEQIVQEIEAELFAESSNPIMRAIGAVLKFVYLILGIKEKGFLVITNKRIHRVTTSVRLWFITTDRDLSYVLPSSVQQVGYIKSPTCWFFCPKYEFYYKTHVGMLRWEVKSFNEKEMKGLVDNFYNALQQ